MESICRNVGLVIEVRTSDTEKRVEEIFPSKSELNLGDIPNHILLGISARHTT